MADDIDEEELKKLTPREKIERLRRLEEQKREELSKAEKMIQDSIKELETEMTVREMEQEMDVPADKTDFDAHFKTHEEPLESVVEKTPVDEDLPLQRQYQASLEELQGGSGPQYSIMRQMEQAKPEEWLPSAQYALNELKEKDSWSSYDYQKFDAIEANLEKMSQYKSLGESMREQVSLGQSIADSIKKYKQ